jgi:hypothetical protein
MLRIMGAFFTVFGVLVLIGQGWPQSPSERLVNAIAGVLLLGIGVGVIGMAGRLARRKQGP